LRRKFLFDEVEEDAVVQFVEQWMNVLGLMARYSPSNTAVAQGMERLFQLLPEVMGRSDALEFSELHNVLQVNGAPLSVEAQERDAIGAFLFTLLHHNIRRCSLSRRITAAEFQVLAEYMQQAADKTSGPLAAILQEQNVTGVTVEQFVEARIGAGAPSTAGPATTAATGPRTPITPLPPPPKLDPRHAREDVRPPDSLRVVIVVRVGPMALDKAEVACGEPAPQSRLTKGESGAVLFLPAGANKIAIHYEDYHIQHAVEIEQEGQVIEVDLQRIFDY
jgi:hypothetical protein